MIQRITIREKKTGQILFEAKVLRSGLETRVLKEWEDLVDVEMRDEKKQKIYLVKWGGMK